MPLKDDGFLVDKSSYQQLWEIVINPTIQDYSNRFAGICCAHDAENAIWKKYVYFNSHCKDRYMQDPSGKLDRHKVCACYMYAVMSANVLSCKLADSDDERKYLALNENLAITTGMSLLRAFILSAIDCSTNLPDDDKSRFRERVAEGIAFPECNHGAYRNNFAAELHYTQEENAYNVLALANTLFLLETYTLKRDAIYKQD